MHDRLGQERRRDVGGHRARLDPGGKLRGRDEPTDTQAWRNGLREGGGIGDERRRPPGRRATAAPRPRSGRARTDRPRAPGPRAPPRARRRAGAARSRASARSGSGRSGSCRGSSSSPAASSRASASGSRPSSSIGSGDDVGAQTSEDLQRPIVGRRLDEHAARPGREELLRVEDEALEPTCRQEDPARIDAVAGAERLAQRRVAAAGAVGEHGGVDLDRGARAVGEQLGVEALRRRRATGERDHGGTP